MKQKSIIIIACLCCLAASCKKDEPAANPRPQFAIPEAVDLGLSVNWASFNLGASSLEGYGNYYAWGETEIKTDYTWNTYKWGDKDHRLLKYNDNPSSGIVDNKQTLDDDDDPARLLGNGWRMPTSDEVKELLDQDKLIIGYETINGVPGILISGRLEGYWDNFIFLPFSGSKTMNFTVGALERCSIRSSSRSYGNNISVQFSRDRNLNGELGSIVGIGREEGIPIRPVKDK